MNDLNDVKREEKLRKITSDPVYPLLVKMAVPSMVGMIVSTVYSMTDTYFVGKLDNVDLTASVGIVYSFVSVIQAIGFWFGYGSGNHISGSLGKKDVDTAERMAATGVLLAVITGLLIILSGIPLLDCLSVLLGAETGELHKATVRYLRITIITVPFMLVSNVRYNQLRLSGAGSDSMTGLLIGMLLNMILDPVFILVLKMDVAGAALASLIGQAAGCLVLFLRMGRNGNIGIKLKSADLSLANIKKILWGGAPNFCRQGISSISSVMLNNAGAIFGNYAIAALTIAVRISYIAYGLVIGFGQGFQPICLVNYGAKKYDRIKKAFLYALATVSVFLVISVGIIYLKSDYLVRHFTSDPDVSELAVRMIHAQCYVMPFMGFYILCGMFLQNIKQFGKATIVTISENGTFLIPFVLILPRVMGLEGLIYCRPVSSIAALLLSLFIGIRAWNRYLRKENDSDKLYSNI